MRESGRLLAQAFEHLEKLLIPGITGKQLDTELETFIRDHGAIPSFKGYSGFPASVCLSFNEEVVHGIPSKRELKPGDLLGIDCGLILDGWHSDMAKSFYIGGDAPEYVQRFIDTTRNSLFVGIQKAVAGNRIGDISNAVQKEVEKKGYTAVEALVGHGIGRAMHEDPQVPNFGPAGQGPLLQTGMTIAIEPMINMGTPAVKIMPDGWTYVTKDAKLSCHFEHTVAVTAEGPQILTAL